MRGGLGVQRSMAVDLAAAVDSAVEQVHPVFAGVATRAASGCGNTARAFGYDIRARAQDVWAVAFGFNAERHFAILDTRLLVVGGGFLVI